jgi:hypothetical protein
MSRHYHDKRKCRNSDTAPDALWDVVDYIDKDCSSVDWRQFWVFDGRHSAYRSGQVTYRQLVQMYLDRLEAYDKQGPRINSRQ